MHRCPFCLRTMPPLEQAIEEGWHPDYWCGGKCFDQPICPECVALHLVEDANGEYILPEKGKPAHV